MCWRTRRAQLVMSCRGFTFPACFRLRTGDSTAISQQLMWSVPNVTSRDTDGIASAFELTCCGASAAPWYAAINSRWKLADGLHRSQDSDSSSSKCGNCRGGSSALTLRSYRHSSRMRASVVYCKGRCHASKAVTACTCSPLRDSSRGF